MSQKLQIGTAPWQLNHSMVTDYPQRIANSFDKNQSESCVSMGMPPKSGKCTIYSERCFDGLRKLPHVQEM